MRGGIEEGLEIKGKKSGLGDFSRRRPASPIFVAGQHLDHNLRKFCGRKEKDSLSDRGRRLQIQEGNRRTANLKSRIAKTVKTRRNVTPYIKGKGFGGKLNHSKEGRGGWGEERRGATRVV